MDSVAILATVALLVYYRWQNTTRDRSMAGQDHKRDIEFSDLTDIENKVGSSSDRPFRSGRAQALIHVSCCRSFDTSTSDSGVPVSFSGCCREWRFLGALSRHLAAGNGILRLEERDGHVPVAGEYTTCCKLALSQQCTFPKSETYYSCMGLSDM